MPASGPWTSERARAFTEVRVGQRAAVGVAAAVGRGLGADAVGGAGLGDGLHQVLVVGVPPAPPAHLRLAAAGDHRPRVLVPGKIKVYSHGAVGLEEPLTTLPGGRTPRRERALGGRVSRSAQRCL